MLNTLLQRLRSKLLSHWQSAEVDPTLPLGDRGEQLAVKHLKGLKYRILETQHRNTYGEVDIIAEDSGCVVFVEVKTRSSTDAGQPLEAVDRRKQQRLTRIALAWLKSKKRLNHPARFDVISIVWPDDAEPELQHFQNAFEPIGNGLFD